MISAADVRYSNRSVSRSAFQKCMGRVPSDGKIPDDICQRKANVQYSCSHSEVSMLRRRYRSGTPGRSTSVIAQTYRNEHVLPVVLYICLRLTYRQGIFRRMVPDPYIFGKLSARRFDCCIVRLQQSSFRLFIARSIIFTLTVSPYGGLK